jgi:hypothetical protein
MNWNRWERGKNWRWIFYNNTHNFISFQSLHWITQWIVTYYYYKRINWIGTNLNYSSIRDVQVDIQQIPSIHWYRYIQIDTSTSLYKGVQCSVFSVQWEKVILQYQWRAINETTWDMIWNEIKWKKKEKKKEELLNVEWIRRRIYNIRIHSNINTNTNTKVHEK